MKEFGERMPQCGNVSSTILLIQTRTVELLTNSVVPDIAPQYLGHSSMSLMYVAGAHSAVCWCQCQTFSCRWLGLSPAASRI